MVSGGDDDYATAHPSTALIVVEVADSSVAQDRLTKAAIYASAGVPQYLLVNLRDDRLEIHTSPDSLARTFHSVRIARRGERLELVGFAGIDVAVDDLLPPPRT
jgi:Uma2 family endonuclease